MCLKRALYERQKILDFNIAESIIDYVKLKFLEKKDQKEFQEEVERVRKKYKRQSLDIEVWKQQYISM